MPLAHRRTFLALLAGLVILAAGIRQAAASVEIEIGTSLAIARQKLQEEQSKITIDTADGSWHILVARQDDRMINLLFEQDRLRYVSYDFYLGTYSPVQGSIAQCNAAFESAVALISKTHGAGNLKRVMLWPEREFTMTWREDRRYAVAREISDLDGCLVVKAFIFDGNEADFQAFDRRLTKP
jgi:hypothetical protein